MAAEESQSSSDRASTSQEKAAPRNSAPEIDLDAVGENEGYVLDTSHVHNRELQTTKDGRTVLIPQPSSSPLDPLNWSSFKKHLILLVVSLTAFLPDYGSATGAVTLIPQAL